MNVLKTLVFWVAVFFGFSLAGNYPVTDSMIQAKLDSLSALIEVNGSEWDSVALEDSTRAWQNRVNQGKYLQRTQYDKSNFDHWKIDTLLQQRKKMEVNGDWHTSILPHGHAFRDAGLRYGVNDTMHSVTYTYTDSARYYRTGEYAYDARYRFDSDSTYRSREVFQDRNVVRWDYVWFQLHNDTLKHHLYKLEFRDLMDNWLDAIQHFDKIPPEIYFRGKIPPTKGEQVSSRGS